MRNVRAVTLLFVANEGAALLALHAGKPAEAELRALENLAASRHFIEQPQVFDAVLGRLFARRSTTLLSLAASRAGDAATEKQVKRLSELLKLPGSHSLPQWLLEQESNPNSNAVELIAANHSLAPSIRTESLHAVVIGGCRSTPEIVFGFSGARRVALTKSIDALRDLNRADEIGMGYVRLYDRLNEDPSTVVEQLRAEMSRVSNTPARAEGMFDWIVPPGVRARVAFCAMGGG